MAVNLSKLTTVRKNFTKTGQVCDIRYSTDQGKFFVNDELFARLNLKDRGFILHYDAETSDMYLSVHPNSKAVMYTGHPSSTSKSKSFQSSEFEKYLRIFGWLTDTTEELKLDLIPEETNKQGLTLYKLNKVGKTSTKEEQSNGSALQAHNVDADDPFND